MDVPGAIARVVPAVKTWARSVKPSRATLKTDMLAGVPGAVGSVPDGMAAFVLAGVNAVHCLYASFAGPKTVEIG
jgi:SulP family sulfate permease